MKILITGATGFIGQHLVCRLLQSGYDLRCTTRPNSRKTESFKDKVEWVIADLTDVNSLKKACKGIDIVIHLAGIIKAHTSEDFFRINTGGTTNLLSAIQEGKKIIFSSSQAAVGPAKNLKPLSEDSVPGPVSAYGQSKLSAEQAIQSKNRLRYTIIRPAIVYGPGDLESLTIFRLAKSHIRPQIGWQKSFVNTVYIDDLVEFIMLCVRNDQTDNEIFHINDGFDGGYTQSDLIRIAGQQMNSRTIPVFIPKSLLKIITLANDASAWIVKKQSMLNSDKYSELTTPGWLLSSEKARTIFNYHPQYDIETGFKITVDWYRKHRYL